MNETIVSTMRLGIIRELTSLSLNGHFTTNLAIFLSLSCTTRESGLGIFLRPEFQDIHEWYAVAQANVHSINT
jgi:hypothetical protein